MIFSYKPINDKEVTKAIQDACDGSYGVSTGARYILKDGILVIAFYTKLNNIKTDKAYTNIQEILDKELPEKYRNYDVWSLEQFYKNVPKLMHNMTGKYVRESFL